MPKSKNQGVKSIQQKSKESRITFKINPQIYPLEVVQGAAYTFVDRFFVDISGSPKKEITVSLSGKDNLSRRELECLKGEFQNELLNCALRRDISRNNKEIREFIVSRALFSSVTTAEEEFALTKKKAEEIQKKDRAQKIKKGDYIDDPLGIAVPWEEKYQKQ